MEVKVEVPWERVKRELDEAFRRVVKDISIPGFRKGKIPRPIFEKRFGKEIVEEEAIRGLYPEIYRKVLDEQRVIPIIPPRIRVGNVSPSEPLVFWISLITRPEVKVGKYKGVEVKRKPVEVEEKEIEKALENLRRDFPEYVPPSPEREIRQGDLLTLDWKIEKGREEEKNFLFLVGSSVFPPSFSRNLLGVRKGEEKKFEVFFPSYFPRKEWRKKKLTFRVKVKEIRETKLPEVSDEFAKRLKFKNLKDLKGYLKERIKKEKEKIEEERIKNELVSRVVENAILDIPPSLVKRERERRMGNLLKQLERENQSLEDFLKRNELTEEEFKKRLEEEIRREFKVYFVLEKIAEEENIEATPQEVEERIEFLARRERIKKEELKKLFREEDIDNLSSRIRREKVVDLLYREAKISESLVSMVKKKLILPGRGGK